MGLLQGLSGKESPCNAGDTGSIPGLERSPGEGNGNPLQYSCLENSMDRGVTVQRVVNSQIWLKGRSTHAHSHLDSLKKKHTIGLFGWFCLWENSLTAIQPKEIFKKSQFCPTQSSLKRGGKTSVTFQEVKANEKFKNHITLITSNIVSF